MPGVECVTEQSTELSVRDLADREAIRDLARRYAHYVWQGSVDGVIDLFTEDGEMLTPDLPPLIGREAIRAAYTKIFAESDLLPFVHNHVIDIDGDTATGTVYLDLRTTLDDRPVVGAGYYEDRYRRVDGTWRIASRDLTMRSFVALRPKRHDPPEQDQTQPGGTP